MLPTDGSNKQEEERILVQQVWNKKLCKGKVKSYVKERQEVMQRRGKKSCKEEVKSHVNER